MKRLIACVAICLVALAVAQPPAQSDPKSLLEAYVSAWNRRDAAAFDRLLSPNAIHEDLAAGFRGQGAAQIASFMQEIIKQEPDFNWHITNVFVSGNSVAAEWTWTATHTGDSPSGPVVGLRISGRGSSVAIVENGRIKRFTDYYDNASFFPKPTVKTAPKSSTMFIPAQQILTDARSTPEQFPGVAWHDYVDNLSTAVEVLRRTKPARAELHKGVVDMWYVVEGAGTLVTGGSLAEPVSALPNDEKWQSATTAPNELRASGIVNGNAQHISKGDFVVIPPNTPHWVSQVEGEIVYMVVKVPPGE